MSWHQYAVFIYLLTSLETEENKTEEFLITAKRKIFKNYISVNTGKWSHEKVFETFTI